jgi:hypothetical protein
MLKGMNTLSLKLMRNKSSYDFRANPKAPDSFDNNWKNNSKDWLTLLAEGKEIGAFRCQSVANYCFGDMARKDGRPEGATIAPGKFQVKCFAPPRLFHGEIHAIINTTDLDGLRIDHNAMQTTKGGFQNGRWLIHDRYSKNTGKDTNSAWSAGCFILSSGDLAAFNKMLHAYKVQPGDIISGEIMEV